MLKCPGKAALGSFGLLQVLILNWAAWISPREIRFFFCSSGREIKTLCILCVSAGIDRPSPFSPLSAWFLPLPIFCFLLPASRSFWSFFYFFSLSISKLAGSEIKSNVGQSTHLIAGANSEILERWGHGRTKESQLQIPPGDGDSTLGRVEVGSWRNPRNIFFIINKRGDVPAVNQ